MGVPHCKMVLDSKNMLKDLKDFPKQCREALELPRGTLVSGQFNKLVVAGMGGSGIAGDILKMYLNELNLPVFVIKDYNLPKFVDKNTLVFAVSYSGNTEESLSAANDAKQKGAKVIAITSNGLLTDKCEKVIRIPPGMQPRLALGYLFFPILGVLHNSNIVNVKNSELNEFINVIKNSDKFDANAQELSKKIKGRIPIIYSSQKMQAVALRWKTQINENAKQPCFYNVFSEVTHNEIAGYKGMDRKFSVIMIRDKYDNPRIRKMMDVCKEIIQERVDVEEVYSVGDSLLSRIFSTIYLGDFVSYHLAIWNRVDPTPVEIIEFLKMKIRE